MGVVSLTELASRKNQNLFLFNFLPTLLMTPSFIARETPPNDHERGETSVFAGFVVHELSKNNQIVEVESRNRRMK